MLITSLRLARVPFVLLVLMLLLYIVYVFFSFTSVLIVANIIMVMWNLIHLRSFIRFALLVLLSREHSMVTHLTIISDLILMHTNVCVYISNACTTRFLYVFRFQYSSLNYFPIHAFYIFFVFDYRMRILCIFVLSLPHIILFALSHFFFFSCFLF